MKKELGPYDKIPCASKYVGERVIDVHKKKPNYFEKWFNTNPNYSYYVDVNKLNALLKQNNASSELRSNSISESIQVYLPSKAATKVPISESRCFAYSDPNPRYIVYDTSKNVYISEDGCKAYLPNKSLGITQCIIAKPGTLFFGDSYKFVHNREMILFSDEGEKISFVGIGFGKRSVQLQFMTYEHRNPMRVRICDMRINGINIVSNSKLEKNCLDTIVIHDETTKIRTTNITFIPGISFNFKEVKELRIFLYVERKQTVCLSDELVLTLNHSSRDYYVTNEFYEEMIDYSAICAGRRSVMR